MYGPLSTQYYDLEKPTAPADELEFYLQMARRSPGPTLEPMCGSGRFLLPMLKSGLRIEGVDSSPEMLDACRARASDLDLTPTLYLQGIEELDLPAAYGFAFIPSGSISLLVDDDILDSALAGLSAHLLPGGSLALELLDRQSLPRDPETSWSGAVRRTDGATIRMSGHLAHYDPSGGLARSVITYRLERRGKLVRVETEDFILRYHDPDDFRRRLLRCGFSRVTLLSPGEDIPAQSSPGSVTLIAHGQPG